MFRAFAEDLNAVVQNDPAATNRVETLLCHLPLHAVLLLEGFDGRVQRHERVVGGEGQDQRCLQGHEGAPGRRARHHRENDPVHDEQCQARHPVERHVAHQRIEELLVCL